MSRRNRLFLAAVRSAWRRLHASLRARRVSATCVWAVVDCPECGEGRVDTLDVTIRARIEYDEWSYRFACPTCARRSVATTSRAAALNAVEAGASLETWRWHTDSGEQDADAPPLSLVDLLDLRRLLSDPGWLETLSRTHNESANKDFDR